MSLVLTYAPRDDESGMGYYRRLSADNALFNWRDLASTAGIERNRRALLTRTDDVARNLGLEPAWTEFTKQQENLTQDWGRLHRAQSDAVCPGCLAESPYLRHHWEHAYVTACPHHRILLVDQCNACGKHLSPERLYIGLCSCGHDLSSLPRVPATRAQQWLSTLIASNGQQAGSVKPPLHGVDINVLVKVIRTLCQYTDPTRPGLPRGAALPKFVTDAVEFLSPLEALLTDWPTGFRNHVEQRIAAGRKDARTLNTLLGDWYISLRKVCQGTTLEPLLQIIVDVAAQKSDCVLGLDSAKAMAEDATGYMRAPDAAKAIGVSVSRLHESILDGECEHRARRTGTRGQLFEIPCAEVERIQRQRAGWISDVDACELAAVPPIVLERMKAAGVIRSDVRWREDLMKGGPVERQSIADLYERAERWAEPDALAEDSTLTWAELTSRRMGDRRAIESLMQAIAKGDVKAVAQGRTLGEMSFLRRDVSQYFGTPLLEAGMSIQQLAKATGWKWESIQHWVDEGLLASVSIQRRGQPCHVVLPHQLLAFRQAYVPLADLARAMGTTSSALSRLLPRVELVGAKRLPDGAMRGALIRIADLGRLAVIGARAGHDLFVPASLAL
ncbi:MULTISPECIES: TniQ family protein [Burkholderia cepacia complex]|uniref:TniQ family protein n=1 Tax=Burkholderia cepacia complex TaxID=87882 RepID=UPI001908C1A8|nr:MULTISPECIES: TniQ family protein [Burkholderia cepacia complex]MBJ9733367.1 TniQ family protein [Burkholderia cenocepacia]MBR8053384.1 TniQ family protein [Burkholderia vietnamiensis]